MADGHVREEEEIIREFLLHTCQLRQFVNEDYVHAYHRSISLAEKKFRRADNVEYGYIPLITGSVAEFYIEPMLPCVGDVDIMCHRSNQLAIPACYPPPTQLPGEFGRRVEVYEIVNSEFPGYVYLWLSYFLTESVDDGKYNAVPCVPLPTINGSSGADDLRHGPALVVKPFRYADHPFVALIASYLGLRHILRSVDNVFCMRCLTWPPQAADWPTRHRNYGWPDSATVNRVVSNGCDVVGVAHRLCRQDEWMGKHQWRLSFSRAEIVLLNSWMPVQQIVYHMLRFFMKTEGLTGSADNSGACILNNYHIKTLMLWACELKSRSWWTEDLNLVRICVELLHTLAVWLTDACCQHYFISNCNFFYQFENSRYTQVTVNRLMSKTSRDWFCEWFIDNYIKKCAQRCPGSVSSLLQDPSSRTPPGGLHRVTCLQNTISEILMWRLDMSLKMTVAHVSAAQWAMLTIVARFSLTLRSCLCWMHLIGNTDQILHLYFTALTFLHVAFKITQGSLKDEMLDVLATTCLQSNDARRCLNARHSSVLSLSQAAMLMKVVANNSHSHRIINIDKAYYHVSAHSTVQLIEIELSKAYLHRALKCKDSDSNSIYCLANVYLAVLYYTTRQYQTATDHCTLITRNLQDHSKCSLGLHVVQGELLPRIDDQVDSILGLTVFYQYIRAAALNEEQERRHVSVFTSELFAHYLHIKFLSVTKYRQLPQPSLANEVQRYRNYFSNSPEIYVTDVMLFRLAHRTKYPSNDHLMIVDRGKTKSSILRELDTLKLVELLQQSAVEHLTTCRELEARDLDSTVTMDFEALYAYKCGQYQHCLELSMRNARRLIVNRYQLYLTVFIVPELIQLMDDDIVSLIGLTLLVNPPRHRTAPPLLRLVIHHLVLSLYLITQCQIKLRHPVTSLKTTLDYARFNEQMLTTVFNLAPLKLRSDIIDQPVLKFVERKILRYISVSQ